VKDTAVRRAVTISRQAGCGAVAIAGKLAAYLQSAAPRPGVNWTVFDRELMDKVLADHNLPGYLAKFLPEDRISAIEDILADMVGMRPLVRTVIEQTTETMLKLASIGSVILIGRGGNIITTKVPHTLRVRLVAPIEDRIERICREDHKSPSDARQFCIEEELARTRYLKTYFNADINDPLHYDLIINTNRLGCDDVAHLIGHALLRLG
jgi:hypothetical protein